MSTSPSDKADAEERSLTVEFRVVPGPDTRQVYSNFASVGSSPWDLVISFGQVRALTNQELGESEQRKGDHVVVEIPSKVDVALPRQVALGLINAIKSQLERSPFAAGEAE